MLRYLLRGHGRWSSLRRSIWERSEGGDCSYSTAVAERQQDGIGSLLLSLRFSPHLFKVESVVAWRRPTGEFRRGREVSKPSTIAKVARFYTIVVSSLSSAT